MFSQRATLVNLAVSFMAHLSYILTVHADKAEFYNKHLLLFSMSLLPMLGMVLSLVLLFLDCCPCSPSPAIQYCALRYTDPLTECVVGGASHHR